MRSTITPSATAWPSRSTWPLMNSMRADGMGEKTAPLMDSAGSPARTSAGNSFSDGTRGSAGSMGLGGVGVTARGTGAGLGAACTGAAWGGCRGAGAEVGA